MHNSLASIPSASMIRLPLSSITLGQSDLNDFERRQANRKAEQWATQEQQILQNTHLVYEYPGQNESTLESSSVDVDLSIYPPPIRPQTAPPLKLHQEHNTDEESQASIESSEHSSLETRSTNTPVQSPENTSAPVLQPSSPAKDHFQFGGFLETLAHTNPDNDTNPSSPFAPEDSSTPVQHRICPHIPTRGRLLPRSPLFHAQNASVSPEHRPTYSFSPQVAARMTEHNSPGILFSHPARRHRRFRHQTNSFSFDESELERSSAAYEQDRVSSISSTDSRPRPDHDISLHEELRGSSLSDSNSVFDLRFPQPEESVDHDNFFAADDSDVVYETATNTSGRRVTQEYRNEETDDEITPQRNREFVFSSPQLPLPPPFSTTSRNVSSAGSLPVSDSPRVFSRSDAPSPATPSEHPIMERNPEYNAREPSGEYIVHVDYASSPRRRNTFQRAAARILTSYRSRSPRHRPDLPDEFTLTPSTTPHRLRERTESRERSPNTPTTPHTSSYYRIYNDNISPFVQPQTPNHLPESRHQSRYHPSYTAPAGANQDRTRRLFSTDGEQEVTTPTGHWRQDVRNRNGRFTARSDSPSGRGMLEDGYQGLYGGRENGSNEQDWVDGIRNSNAEVRSWGMRDIRDEGIRYTPDREERRAGRY